MPKKNKVRRINCFRSFHSGQIKEIDGGCGFARVIQTDEGDIDPREVGVLVVVMDNDDPRNGRRYKRPIWFASNNEAIRIINNAAYDQYGNTYQFQGQHWQPVRAKLPSNGMLGRD